MKDPISIRAFIIAIRKLPADPSIHDPSVWYRTQKEHWLGWLKGYNGPGAYGRLNGPKRDAKFSYNHIVNPDMLLYLSKASGVDRRLLSQAKRASDTKKTLMQKAAMIRTIIPWSTVASALWADYAR